MLPIPPYIPIMGLQIQRRKTSCYQGFQRVIATFANSLRVAAGIHRKNTSDLGTRNIEKLPSVHLVLHKRMVEKTSRLQVARWSSIGGSLDLIWINMDGLKKKTLQRGLDVTNQHQRPPQFHPSGLLMLPPCCGIATGLKRHRKVPFQNDKNI